VNDTPLLVMAPLGVEARALGRGAPGAAVVRTGAGGRRAGATARRLAPAPATAVAIAGVAGGLDRRCLPGDLVVADRILDPSGTCVVDSLASAGLLAAALRRAGLRVFVGAVVTADRPVTGSAKRAALATTGARAVDMESAPLAAAGWAGPVAVVRAIVDTPGRELLAPATIIGGIRALHALRQAAPVLASWAAATGSRRVLLAAPRSFCAGVERAVRSVEGALERFGRPVYVRRQIVHNRHVVAGLEARGAVFVDELSQVPDGATVVFSAHGVSPGVRYDATRRRLAVVDATCPLVAKVHSEVRRYRERGYQVVLVGHRGHDEVDGTLGEDPAITLVETADDVARLRPPDPAKVAYATQTTLATDETAGVITALRDRFSALVGPRTTDICYATQNRQDAVRALAGRCDLVLVVGSANSSNTARLAEVAQRGGARAETLDDGSQLDLRWLTGARTVGITAGASAPEHLVQSVVTALGGLGPLEVSEDVVTTETVAFSLPPEVR